MQVKSISQTTYDTILSEQSKNIFITIFEIITALCLFIIFALTTCFVIILLNIDDALQAKNRGKGIEEMVLPAERSIGLYFVHSEFSAQLYYITPTF